ncbi:GNAT family N-acetyltransferase [Chitinimonas naiadis]
MTVWIDTARLRLRPWRAQDLDDFAALTANADVMRWVGDGSLLSREATADWIEKANGNLARWGYGTHAVTARDGGTVMGWAGLIHTDNALLPARAEIIYALKPDCWGKGYATELAGAMTDWAWRHTALDDIIATVDPTNLGSLAVLGKLGFLPLLERLDEDGLPEAHWLLSRPLS